MLVDGILGNVGNGIPGRGPELDVNLFALLQSMRVSADLPL